MAVLLFAANGKADETVLENFSRTHVLGTSFEMSIDVARKDAEAAEKAVISEIKRLEKIFSTYDRSSEVSQLNLEGAVDKNVSDELLDVINRCTYWQKQLTKSFSCKMGQVVQMWQNFEQQQARPDRVLIRERARAAQQSDYDINDLLSGKPNNEFSWDFNGIAKGYILDKAMTIAKLAAPNASAIKLDIGGDAVYWQSTKSSMPIWSVGVAVPGTIDDSQETRLGTYRIRTGAIAYSGHSSRARKIERREYSHLLAPRDGWPRHNPVTAIVKAENAVSADALATALATSDISVSLDWLAKHPQYSALLIDNEGRHYASSNWYQGYIEKKADTDTSTDYQTKISFTLPKISTAKYRKPYVSLWVTDKKGKIVKTLMVLGKSERWMQENRSWWRIQGRKSPQLLDGFARPTRRPGQYNVIWNGRDDFGNLLSAGEYRLFIEASREHGDHEKLSIPFELGAEKQKLSKKGNKEIEKLVLESF